jgi:hypothetical protein
MPRARPGPAAAARGDARSARQRGVGGAAAARGPAGAMRAPALLPAVAGLLASKAGGKPVLPAPRRAPGSLGTAGPEGDVMLADATGGPRAAPRRRRRAGVGGERGRGRHVGRGAPARGLRGRAPEAGGRAAARGGRARRAHGRWRPARARRAGHLCGARPPLSRAALRSDWDSVCWPQTRAPRTYRGGRGRGCLMRPTGACAMTHGVYLLTGSACRCGPPNDRRGAARAAPGRAGWGALCHPLSARTLPAPA